MAGKGEAAPEPLDEDVASDLLHRPDAGAATTHWFLGCWFGEAEKWAQQRLRTKM